MDITTIVNNYDYRFFKHNEDPNSHVLHQVLQSVCSNGKTQVMTSICPTP